MAQTGVDDKPNAIPAAGQVRVGLVLRGRGGTRAARLTPRALAEQSVAGGGDYVMLSKGKQPTLAADMAARLGSPPPRGHSVGAAASGTRGTDAAHTAG